MGVIWPLLDFGLFLIVAQKLFQSKTICTTSGQLVAIKTHLFHLDSKPQMIHVLTGKPNLKDQKMCACNCNKF